MKLKFAPLFILPLVDPQVNLQRDIFIRENLCQQKTENYHDVLSVSFQSQNMRLNQPFKATIKELESGNEQNIHFKTDHFLYPGLFNGIDHKEYNIPECKKNLCRHEMYIFLAPWKNLKEKFTIEMKIMDLQNKEILQHRFSTISNSFVKFSDFPRIDMNVDPKGFIRLPYTEVKKLKDFKISDIEFVFQWRQGAKIGYSEKNQTYHLPKINSDILFTHTIKSPSYLGAMLMFKKNDLDFELKKEVINKKDPFFSCQK